MLLTLDSRTHVRCRKCEARRVLSRHPDRYARLAPVCRTPGCGSRDYRADKWMNNRNTGARGSNAQGCNCGGYWFTHRRGSPWCHDNPLSPMFHADRQGEAPGTILELAASIKAQFPSFAERVAELCDRWQLNDQPAR